ncbi:hypothetical protein [Achromobacter phage Motura]|uniref:Uncharacterized protein n=1 Tax=Achromobacter phage Motura TaxID=2591403 RepID=A0A514CT97_9CAUD|nr:hypothetical protein H1O15_gp119 [Achromobacter phage Motura]QDH83709.1 hypothetical protein [Achromobacter phage Motura]
MPQIESRFYLPLDIYRGTSQQQLYAPFVTSLPLQYGNLDSAVVLSADEGQAQQGLYFFNDTRYVFAVDQKLISLVIKGNYDISLYFQLAAPVAIPEDSMAYRAGIDVSATATEVPASSNDVWIVITEKGSGAGTVKSVNNQLPDAEGNVEIPNATTTEVGLVSVESGGGLLVDSNGQLSVDPSIVGGAFTPSNTFFVDPKGDAILGNGSWSQPFKTITAALAAITTDTLVLVTNATYAESIRVGDIKFHMRFSPGAVLNGSVTITGGQDVVLDGLDLAAQATGAQIRAQGYTGNIQLRNFTTFANNTQIAYTSDVATTGVIEFFNLMGVLNPRLQHNGGTLKFQETSGQFSLEVNGGTVYGMECDSFSAVNHTNGRLFLDQIARIGTSPGVAAINSSATKAAGGFLSLANVALDTSGGLSYINKTGDCDYQLFNTTRNLDSDVLNGDDIGVKSAFDVDTLVTRAGVNYTGAAKAPLVTHLEGLDDALGTKLGALTNVGTTGNTLVSTTVAGGVKSIVAGTGMSMSANATEVTITNSGVLALSSVTGTDAFSLVNNPNGVLAALKAGTGITMDLTAGILTFNSTATSGVESINGQSGPLTFSGVGIDIQPVAGGFEFRNLVDPVTSLNAAKGAVTIQAGTGIGVDTTGQNITITSLGAAASVTDLNSMTGSVKVAAGTGVAVNNNPVTKTITLSSNMVGGVASVNTLQGALNFVGDGIDITASGSDSLIFRFAGTVTSGVNAVNAIQGDVTLQAQGGIDLVTDLGSNTITLSSAIQQGVIAVQNDAATTTGAVSLVSDSGQGTGNTALIRRIVGGTNTLVDLQDGVITVSSTGGGSGGGGGIQTINGVAPDGAGNLELAADDVDALPIEGGTMQGAINMGGSAITNLAQPVNDDDAVTKVFLQTLTFDRGTF